LEQIIGTSRIKINTVLRKIAKKPIINVNENMEG
jgi:hypothetical protein